MNVVAASATIDRTLLGSSMQIKNLGRCRGEEKLYMLLRIDGCSPDFISVSASSRESAVLLPASYVVLSSDGVSCELVVVLFDTRINQVLRIEDRDGGKMELPIYPRVFSLASKFNGRFRKKLCSKIRSIDSYGLFSSIALSCELVVPQANGGAIIKGAYACPCSSPKFEVRAFDRMGKMVGSDSRVIGVDSVDHEASISCSVARGYYSVSVPSLREPLCLALFDGQGNQVGAELVLDQFKLKVLSDEMRMRFSSALDQDGYENWLFSHRLTIEQMSAQTNYVFRYRPLFSIIVPLYKTPLPFFRDMADSVLRQTYENWELILVNSTPADLPLAQLVSEYENRDERIKVVNLDDNYGITENTNRGIEAADGDFVCFFDHDDVLEPDILFEYASALNADNDINLLYCDEDKLFPDGHFGNPTLKPDFSLDMIRDNNYICHLLAVRKAVYDRIEPSTSDLDGAQDHAMVLKIIEQGGNVHHVPRVLYHWRMSENSTAANSDSKPYATIAGIHAVQQHLDRLGVDATVECSHGRAFRYLSKYSIKNAPLVSIVIPTAGRSLSLTRFLSALRRSDYREIEVTLVSSKDCMNDISAVCSSINDDIKCQVVEAPGDFAISRWLNAGADAAHGSVLVFCHDDIVPVNDDWISVLVGHSLRSEVGVVGTMTLSDDNTIQQAGLAYIGSEIINLSAGIAFESPGYIFLPHTTRNVSAVDGACLAVRREVFAEVGGFDIAYSRSYSNVDLCFRAEQSGYLTVYTPEAVLKHLSVSDGGSVGLRRRNAVYYRDKAHLLLSWSEKLSEDDPFFNPNFSRNVDDASQYRLDMCGCDSSKSY